MANRPEALVIDKASPLRDSVAAVLRALGWDVTTADDAAAGLSELFQGEHRWSLLFCDLSLCEFDVPERFAQGREGYKLVMIEGGAGAVNAVSIADQLARLTLEIVIQEAASAGAYVPLKTLTRLYARRVLEHTKGKKKDAAAILGLDRKTLDRLLGTKKDETNGDGTDET